MENNKLTEFQQELISAAEGLEDAAFHEGFYRAADREQSIVDQASLDRKCMRTKLRELVLRAVEKSKDLTGAELTQAENQAFAKEIFG